MKLIFKYMKRYAENVCVVMLLKILGTLTELLLPYILEHLLDRVVPKKNMSHIIVWGVLMIVCAFFTMLFNVCANKKAVYNAHNISYDVRRDLFNKTINLSGSKFDEIGLPSLTSRMTSDSYNVQNFTRAFQTLCVRAPIMLTGGVVISMIMDFKLSLVLVAIVPILLLITITISKKGIPMYKKVQDKLDDVVRVMRENITGIRVVKSFSKTSYEKKRFHRANEELTEMDIKTNNYMAIPGPFMQLCLNVGLSAVAFVGAVRVNSGEMDSGVILAFLTYFNMITQSIMAINRMFVMISKATASADRINQVINAEEVKILPGECKSEDKDEEMPFIRFENVDFSYVAGQESHHIKTTDEPEKCLDNISFDIKKGESLGIIGPTGCGKSTIVNLLIRFYDADAGKIYVDGKDVRTYEKDELHSKFGVVFQNDIIFNDTLKNNIKFGRDLSDEEIKAAVADSMAEEFINELDSGLDYMADIKGANLSGGQKQRILVARALAGKPEILILDDSSSALDYKTDSRLRRAIRENHNDSTLIIIAQRVSSIMGMTNIMVLDNGKCIGYGKHEDLLKTCEEYRETYEAQMQSF